MEPIIGKNGKGLIQGSFTGWPILFLHGLGKHLPLSIILTHSVSMVATNLQNTIEKVPTFGMNSF